jgi:hypothetical protein
MVLSFVSGLLFSLVRGDLPAHLPDLYAHRVPIHRMMRNIQNDNA